MLSVINFVTVDFKRGRAAAYETAALEDLDGPSTLFEIDGSGKTG